MAEIRWRNAVQMKWNRLDGRWPRNKACTNYHKRQPALVSLKDSRSASGPPFPINSTLSVSLFRSLLSFLLLIFNAAFSYRIHKLVELWRAIYRNEFHVNQPHQTGSTTSTWSIPVDYYRDNLLWATHHPQLHWKIAFKSIPFNQICQFLR